MAGRTSAAFVLQALAPVETLSQIEALPAGSGAVLRAADLIERLDQPYLVSETQKDGGCVIGYGHKTSGVSGVRMSHDEARAVLFADLLVLARQIERLVGDGLNEMQQGALYAFAHSIGYEAFRTSDVLRLVRDGCLLEAADALEGWRSVTLDGERVLVDQFIRRRAAEKALFLSPLAPERPPINRNAEQDQGVKAPGSAEGSTLEDVAPGGAGSSDAVTQGGRRGRVAGSAAVAVVSVIRIGLQTLILPILARLLGPEAYGVMGMAMPVVLFALLFGGAGLGPTFVRAQDPSREFTSTIFWLSGAIGLGLALLIAAAAWPVGLALHNRQFAPVLASLCAILVFSSLSTVPYAILQREGRYFAIAGSDLVSALASIGVAVFVALHHGGAWSLVAQQLSLWILRFGTIFVAARFRPAMVWDARAVRGVGRFSAALTGSSLVDFVGRNLDNLLIGGILGVRALGYYTLAYQIIRMPEMVLSGAVSLSLIPIIVDRVAKQESGAEPYLGALRTVLLLSAPLMVGLAVTSDLLVHLLFGEKWSSAAGVLMALTPAGEIFVLLGVNAAALTGLGEANVQFKMTVLATVGLVVGILGGLSFGSQGVAVGCSLGLIVTAIPYFLQTWKRLSLSPRRALSEIGPIILSSIMVACVAVIIKECLTPLRLPWLTLAMMGVGGGVTYLFGLWWSGPVAWKTYIETLHSTLLKKIGGGRRPGAAALV